MVSSFITIYYSNMLELDDDASYGLARLALALARSRRYNLGPFFSHINETHSCLELSEIVALHPSSTITVSLYQSRIFCEPFQLYSI